MLLQDLGVNVADVLRRAELPQDLFARPDATLDTAAYFRLWEAIDAEIDDPTLPVRIAEAITAEGFSPPLFAALCAPDLEVALERLSLHKRLLAPMRLDVARDDDAIHAGFRFLDAATPAPSSLVATELALLVQLGRMATRARIRPRQVTMPASTRPRAELEAFFGTRVTAGEAFSVTFSLDDARRPFLTANEAMWTVFEPELRRRLSELDERASMTERVGAVLLESLPAGQASMEEVARRLGVSKRTLQRRLRSEDSSYQRILARTRERLARHYLTKTQLPCSEISFLLGYDEPNSFFRAFQEWTGDSPERMRQAMTVH